MRRLFDALALAVRERLSLDPESGALFVFASKRGNRLKVLWFDHNGYYLLYKRLHGALSICPRPVIRAAARVARRTLARDAHPRRRKMISALDSRVDRRSRTIINTT
ncbi:MAG: IS66 family insertion sequence element accessory protein TnpB [Polyangiaceae bacterium]